MNREDVIRMAREAGGIDVTTSNAGGVTAWLGTATPEFLERFAKLVAAAEREACAKVCEARNMGDNNREDMEAKRCAAAIRARGEP